MLSPIIPPQTPIAWARSRGSSNTLRMIDIATGLSIEPPIACSTRAAISSWSVGASAHSSEPAENTTRPIWNTLRRPIRSAVDPTASAGWRSSACRRRSSTEGRRREAPNERWMAGSATLTIVTSRPTISRLIEQMTRISRRRRRLRSEWPWLPFIDDWCLSAVAVHSFDPTHGRSGLPRRPALRATNVNGPLREGWRGGPARITRQSARRFAKRCRVKHRIRRVSRHASGKLSRLSRYAPLRGPEHAPHPYLQWVFSRPPPRRV